MTSQSRKDTMAEINFWHGQVVADLIRAQGGLIVPREVGLTARLLARAAFRAVPGLREAK